MVNLTAIKVRTRCPHCDEINDITVPQPIDRTVRIDNDPQFVTCTKCKKEFLAKLRVHITADVGKIDWT